MLQLPVTKSGNSEVDVTIGGEVITLKYYYNTRNERLYLSIYKNEDPVVDGLRLIEGGVPIVNYVLDEISGYQLIIVKDLEGTGFVTIGNLGIDREYLLVLLTPEDLGL